MKKLSAFLGLMKKSKLLTFLVCNLGLLIPAITLSTVAWFSNQSQITPNIESSVVTSYFEGGDGTENNPYIIYRPVQYYNLVRLYANSDNTWLDRSSYFAFGDDKDEDGVYKFASYNNDGVAIGNEESTSLNMGYYNGTNDRLTIIPLGDQNNPFEGHIIGRGLTVANLIVEGKGMPDVGIFGYVTEDARIENAYFKNVRININNPSLTNSHGHDDDVRVGHIAGHAVDAKSSFNNVYTSDNKIYNSRASSLIKSNFGDYGKNDAIQNLVTGTNESFSLNPQGIYNTIDSTYESSSGKPAISRNTEYSSNTTTGESYGNVISKNNNTYSINNTSHNNSLSTVGYMDSEVVKNYTYSADGTGGDQRPLPNGFLKTNTAPSDQTSTGDFTYFDSNRGNWVYYHTWSDSQTTTQVEYSIFTISYSFQSRVSDDPVTYYLTCGENSWSTTSTEPITPLSSNIQNNAAYWWSFVIDASSSGLSTISSSDGPYYTKIYSPFFSKYLYVGGTGKYHSISLVSSINDATTFRFNGPNDKFFYGDNYGYAITATLNSDNTLSNSLIGSQPNTPRPGVTFKISAGAYGSTVDPNSFAYYMIKDLNELTDGCIVSIATNYNSTTAVPPGPKAMSTQGDHNRTYAPVKMETVGDNPTTTAVETSSTKMTYNTAYETYGGPISRFRVNVSGTTSKTYTFFDLTANAYIYASGGTGKNYMNTQTTNNSNGIWTITMDSSYNVTITCTNSSTTRNTIRYNTGKLFSCYLSTTSTSTSTYADIQLYKEDANSTGEKTVSEALTYTSSVHTGGTLQYNVYDAYISDINTTIYTKFQIPESINSSVVFDNINSKVTYTYKNPDTWHLVTNINSISKGDTIAFVARSANKAASNTYDTNGYSSVDIVKNTTDNTIEQSGSDLIGEFIFNDGYNNGTYSFKNTDTEEYLSSAVNSKFQHDTTLQSSSSWSITITNTTTGQCSITNSAGGSYSTIYYNSTSNVFDLSGTSSANICIYKKVLGVARDFGVTYPSDSFGGGYEPTLIDVVGNALIGNNYIKLDSNHSNSMTFDEMNSIDSSTYNIGSRFYNTQYGSDCIVLYIPNTGSLDLGTFDIYYAGAGGSTPEFMKGENDDGYQSSSLTSMGANPIVEDNKNHIEFSLNMYNIYEACYCALDENGNIYASYEDGTSTPTLSAADYSISNISTFVVMITNSYSGAGSSLNIYDLNYEFVSLTGNTGDHGTSGYMEASYSDGSLDTSNSRLEGTILNFYYNVPTGERVDVEVTFDKSTMTYNVTFKSTIDMNVNFFNYHAEKYKLVVNGTSYTRGSQTVPITASTW